MVLVWGPEMILAANSSTSTAGVWAIVAVAVVCLAFWLIMVVGVAARPEDKEHRRQLPLPPANMPFGAEETSSAGPITGGTFEAEGGRSVTPRPDAPAVVMAGARGGAGGESEATKPGAGHEPAVTREDMPTVPGPRSAAPFGMTTSAGYPAGTTPRAPRDMPDPGVQWTKGAAGPSVPAPRESATDQSARSRQGDRDRES